MQRDLDADKLPPVECFEDIQFFMENYDEKESRPPYFQELKHQFHHIMTLLYQKRSELSHTIEQQTRARKAIKAYYKG